MRGTDPLRTSVALLASLALLLVLLGCSDDSQDDDSGPVGSSGSSEVGIVQARAQEQRILNQRARAVRDRDVGLFLKRVDRRNQGLVARQRRYFDNLVQLPLATFSWRVSDQQWDGVKPVARWGKDVHVPRVQLTTQLDGYDAVPVVRTVGFVFSLRNGRATIVSDRTHTGRRLFEGTPAPWDLTAVTVRAGRGVLGIFDSKTRASAPAVLTAVQTGIGQIDRALPFSWPGRVVVYSVGSPRVLASFTDVPGGTLEDLGALTFPTYAQTGRTRVASTRMLVMPSSVEAGEPFLGRITRHELSHVALGIRDDRAPAWVSEGVAEYLGARETPERERIIATSALSRARTTDAGMPSSRPFNGPDQDWNYALSWMACDHIVATHGEPRLWELVEAMRNGGKGTTDAQQDRVLVQVLGYDSRELSRRAAARIRSIFG